MASTDVDLQRLLVQMEASFVKYERAWQRNLGVTDAGVKQVQQRFGAMEKSINAAGANTARSLNPIAGQTSNIAAQFQDIAVMLQAGQSPFTIAMQQGTQLSAVLNQAKNPVAALGAAFVQMLNPVSLATIAVIALGGAAIQWLTRTEDKAKDAEDAFASHVARIKEITRGYDEAEKAANAYIEQNRKLPQDVASSDLSREREAALGRFSGIIDQVSAKQTWLNDQIAYFTEIRLDPAILGQFQNLSAVVAAAGLSSESSQAEVNALLSTLRRIGDTTADTDLRDVIDALEALLIQASDAAVEVGSLTQALNNVPSDVRVRINLETNAQSALQQLRDLAPELRDASTVAREQAKALAERASLGVQSIAGAMAIASQLEETLAAIDEAERRQNEKSSQGGRDKIAGEAERQRQAVLDLISSLKFEQEQLGQTALQQEINNTLREAGAAATPKQREEIEALVTAIYNESAALEQADEDMRAFAAAGRQALQGFIQDMLAGKDATEALNNALKNIGNRLIDMGLDAIFGGGKKGGTGLIGQLFGFADGGIARNGKPLKTFARGGVSKTAAIFGEGPMAEAAVPLPDGRRIPVDLRVPALPPAAANSNGDITYAPNITMQDGSPESLAGLQRVLAEDKANFDARVKNIIRSRGTKWR